MAEKIKWVITPEMLTEKVSFLSWKYIMEMNYSGYDLSKNILTGEVVIEEVVSDSEVSTIVRKDQNVYSTSQGKPYLHAEAMMKALLIRYIPDSLAIQLLTFKRFKEQWNKLIEIKTGQTGARLIILGRKLSSLKWTGSLDQVCSYFTTLVNEYKLAGGEIDENSLVEKLFLVLPRTFNSVKLLLRREALQRNQNLKLEETIRELQIANIDLKEDFIRNKRKNNKYNKKGSEESFNKKNSKTNSRKQHSSSSKDISQVKCFKCNKLGHYASSCKNIKDEEINLVDLDKISEDQSKDLEFAGMMLDSTVPKDSKGNIEFIVDSGATTHVVQEKYKHLLEEVKPTNKFIKTVGDGILQSLISGKLNIFVGSNEFN